MSRVERGLSAVATVIVVLWLGAYLAWEGYATAQVAAVVEVARAPVRPPPLPELPPLASEPPPESEPPPPAATPEPVGAAQLAMGHELLASGGAFPALNATYEDFGSFREYAQSMLRLGARFVVVRDQRIVGAADIETGALRDFEGGVGFSPIPRDYSDEPALALANRAARGQHGGAARVKMLLPRGLDAGLFGGIAEVLSGRGEAPDAYTEIQGRYEPAADGGVWFRIESGTRSDGASIPLSRVFDLSALAARGPSA